MLPNGEHAVVDLRKLVLYCLDSEHPRGKHKARVFAAALGLASAEAGVLRDALLDAARTRPARQTEQDQFGRRFTLDFPMTTDVGAAIVRSSWIIRHGEDFPRLTTCFVL